MDVHCGPALDFYKNPVRRFVQLIPAQSLSGAKISVDAMHVIIAFLIMYIAVQQTITYASNDRIKLIIENFTGGISETGLPPEWYASRADKSMFSIVEESGDRFARVNARDGCTSFGRNVQYSVQEFPILTWKWRVHQLPTGGSENTRERNDSGAAVYVIFKGKLKLNKIIKYVWSSNLPVGTSVKSPYNKRAWIVVLKKGKENIGTWVHESVNVKQDFIRLFNEEPPLVIGIAILSDSDNTHSTAIADYDAFAALRD